VNRFIIAAVAVFLAVYCQANVANAVAISTPIYRLTDLGTLGGTTSGAAGVNDNGQVAGAAATPGGTSHAFLYSGGVMTDLGTLGGTFSSGADAINSAGEVVGQASTSAGLQHAFLYSGGAMSDLGTLGGTFSVAQGINAAGSIVGRSVNSGGQVHAFLYSGGMMTDLGTLGGASSSALGISVNGQIVGYANLSSGQQEAFLYSNGDMTDLGNLGGTHGSGAVAINAAGQIAGGSYVSGGGGPEHSHAFLYSGGVMKDLGTLGGPFSGSYGMNDLGQVVGYSDLPNSAGDAGFLYSGTVMTNINTLLDNSAQGWNLIDAVGINNNGWIVGDAYNPSHVLHAYLLTPVPEPNPLLLSAIGAAMVLIYIRRRVCRRERPV
jgi:probable HAF family extracellular repeat protein